MCTKIVGVVVAIVIGAMFLFVPSAKAETLLWNAVTTYSDGTSLGTKPVTYNVYDNVFHATNPIASGLSSVSWGITNKGSGVSHGFEITAVVDGQQSARSARLNWTSPLLVPASPTGLTIQ